MAITAENLAKKYGVLAPKATSSRLASQERALAAQGNGFFAEEIVAVEVPGPKGTTIRIEKDEGPRAGLTMEKLGKLPARFVKDGVVTPGNASGITDGAAAVVLTTVKQAKSRRALLDGTILFPAPSSVWIRRSWESARLFDSESFGGRQRGESTRWPSWRSTKPLRRKSSRVFASSEMTAAKLNPQRRSGRARASARRLGRAISAYDASRASQSRRRLWRRFGLHRWWAGYRGGP